MNVDNAPTPDAEPYRPHPPNTTDWVQAHQTHYDAGGPDDLAATVVRAVADVKDVDPLDEDELPTLHDTIDVTALEPSFFRATKRNGHLAVTTFIYADTQIQIHADGWIYVFEQR